MSVARAETKKKGRQRSLPVAHAPKTVVTAKDNIDVDPGVSHEELRQLSENLMGFFSLLHQWDSQSNTTVEAGEL